MEELSKEILELLKGCTYEEKEKIINKIVSDNPVIKGA